MPPWIVYQDNLYQPLNVINFQSVFNPFVLDNAIALCAMSSLSMFNGFSLDYVNQKTI